MGTRLKGENMCKLLAVPYIYLAGVLFLSCLVKFSLRKESHLSFKESWVIAFNAFNYIASGGLIKGKY